MDPGNSTEYVKCSSCGTLLPLATPARAEIAWTGVWPPSRTASRIYCGGYGGALGISGDL